MTTHPTVAPASVSMLLAVVDMAKQRKYESGILGVLANPNMVPAHVVQHAGQSVSIRAAISPLAAHEAVREHVEGEWSIVVTDCDDHDLGAGILAHFVGSRLWRPDAWEALRHAFSASGVAPALASRPGSRELANALLAARPPEGWPAAPAGVLTRAHAMSCVARTHLGLMGDVVDAITVLGWSALPQATTALADLREMHGDTLHDALVEWIVESAGAAGPPLGKLLRAGAVQELVPLGIALRLLTADDQTLDERHTSQLASVRLEQVLGKPLPGRDALVAHALAAIAVLDDLSRTDRNDAHVQRLLGRADEILASLDATSLAVHSDVLPSAFRQRLLLLASSLVRGVEVHATGQSVAQASQAIESAWQLCSRHRMVQRGLPEALAFHAAVRLWRWITSPDIASGADLVTRVRAHMEHGSWADIAINDVDTGVDQPELIEALRAVYDAAMTRRTREELGFADHLAAMTETDSTPWTPDGLAPSAPLWLLESLLPTLVIPMSKQTPVLLVIMDGMSSAAANEVVADVTRNLGWVEAGSGRGVHQRAAALAVLPSVTEVSRASLLCGSLRRGGQDVERTGYADLTRKAAKIRAELFHKKGIDTTRPGALVADGVAAAIDDGVRVPLVTVVLNTIDDALDRSDPVGTVWTADAVKHLTPLLGRARAAGRTVVVTADHGHVVERRRGEQRSVTGMSSGRSRSAQPPAQSDEVAVQGPRVLTDDHQAVLAVSEGLRYGPLKAGYHGGASAQEVVVPVIVLLPDESTNPLALPLLAPQEPTWWAMPEAGSGSAPDLDSQPHGIPSRGARLDSQLPGPTLFDDPDPGTDQGSPSESLGAKIVASETYAMQRKVLSRLTIRDDQIRALIDALDSGPGERLPRSVVAAKLGVPAFRVDGALSQVRQLLNIEGYNVLAVDADGQTVVLDRRLLREQFEVS